MTLRRRTVIDLAEMICGERGEPWFVYRRSTNLTEFFADVGTDHEHDGSTRRRWVADVLHEFLREPWTAPQTPPAAFRRVIVVPMDRDGATGEGETPDWPRALACLDASRAQGVEAFYGETGSVISATSAPGQWWAWTPRRAAHSRQRSAGGGTSSSLSSIGRARTSRSRRCSCRCSAGSASSGSPP